MFGWRNNHETDDNHSDGRDSGSQDSDSERRAADILRRLGSSRGDDGEVVDDFMRRVDERAETMREDEEKKRHSWW